MNDIHSGINAYGLRKEQKLGSRSSISYKSETMPNLDSTTQKKCPECLELVDELIAHPEYQDEYLCLECLEHQLNEEALRAEERRQYDEDINNDYVDDEDLDLDEYLGEQPTHAPNQV